MEADNPCALCQALTLIRYGPLSGVPDVDAHNCGCMDQLAFPHQLKTMGKDGFLFLSEQEACSLPAVSGRARHPRI